MIEIVESRKATEEEMKQYAEKEAEKLIPEWKRRMLHVFLGGFSYGRTIYTVFYGK